VTGTIDAEHEEAATEAAAPFMGKLNCSLVGKTQTIHITPGTLTAQIYAEKKSVSSSRATAGAMKNTGVKWLTDPLK
jgi:hypothetical protein